MSTELRMVPSTLLSAVQASSNEEWTAALTHAARALSELALGVGTDVTLDRSRTPIYRRDVSAAELYFRQEGIYFFTAEIEPQELYVWMSSNAVQEEESSNRRPPKCKVRVGLITADVSKMDQLLSAFSEKIGSLLETQASDSAQSFEWSDDDKVSGFQEMMRERSESAGIKFKSPVLNQDEVDAARALTSKDVRNTLIEVSRGGFVRVQDVTANKPAQDVEAINEALTSLRSLGLVRSEYSLECKSKNLLITRIPSREHLEQSSVGELPCPHCNTRFQDEAVREVVALSDLGRLMISKSYWMTVWITDVLVGLGIDLDRIVWNLTEQSEEIDVLVDMLGDPWIFELKARDFGSGDAYPLNYRLTRYRARTGVIVTTGQVAPDAKRVFDDIERERRRGPRESSGPTVFMIEGLSTAVHTLGEQIDRAVIGRVKRSLAPVEEYSGFRLDDVLTRRFSLPEYAQIEAPADEVIFDEVIF